MPTPELTYNPTYAYEVTPEWDTGVTSSRNGTERRASRRASAVRSWDLVFRNLNATDFAGFQTFFNARKGRYEAFNWTCLADSTQYLVRFDSDSLAFTQTGYGRYEVKVRLRQVTA
jgi:hypothetical protein